MSSVSFYVEIYDNFNQNLWSIFNFAEEIIEIAGDLEFYCFQNSLAVLCWWKVSKKMK